MYGYIKPRNYMNVCKHVNMYVQCRYIVRYIQDACDDKTNTYYVRVCATISITVLLYLHPCSHMKDD